MYRWRALRLSVMVVHVCLLVAACENDPFAPPPVTATFVTPEYFHLAVSGEDASEAPGLRAKFLKEVEAFARANGCSGYRVLREEFTTSANVSPLVSTDPSLIFGRRPSYNGVIECMPPAPATAATRAPVSQPTRLIP